MSRTSCMGSKRMVRKAMSKRRGMTSERSIVVGTTKVTMSRNSGTRNNPMATANQPCGTSAHTIRDISRDGLAVGRRMVMSSILLHSRRDSAISDISSNIRLGRGSR